MREKTKKEIEKKETSTSFSMRKKLLEKSNEKKMK